MSQFRDLAELEYAVKRGDMSKPAALTEARVRGIDEYLLDDLQGGPCTTGTTVFPGGTGRSPLQLRLATSTGDDVLAHRDTPINRQLRDLPFQRIHGYRPLTQRQVEVLAERFSDRLGVPVRVDWASDSTRIEIDVMRGNEIVVPGGIVRHAGVDQDTLALIVAHEFGHIHLRSGDEALVDYWAARHGLRLLWQGESNQVERGVLAAYSMLMFLAEGTTEPLQLICADNAAVTMQLGGYPTLQSRWQLYKAGIFDLPCPDIIRPL